VGDDEGGAIGRDLAPTAMMVAWPMLSNDRLVRFATPAFS